MNTCAFSRVKVDALLKIQGGAPIPHPFSWEAEKWFFSSRDSSARSDRSAAVRNALGLDLHNERPNMALGGIAPKQWLAMAL